MPTQVKAEKIDELTEKLARAKLEFQIAKNTLLRIATERNNMTELDKSIFNGQTAVAFSYDDEVAAAKAVTDYTHISKIVVLKSGILSGRTLTAEQVEDLAKIPGGKNYAKAQIVGVMQGPLATTYSLLTAPLRDLCYVLQAHAEQLNGEATPEEE